MQRKTRFSYLELLYLSNYWVKSPPSGTTYGLHTFGTVKITKKCPVFQRSPSFDLLVDPAHCDYQSMNAIQETPSATTTWQTAHNLVFLQTTGLHNNWRFDVSGDKRFVCCVRSWSVYSDHRSRRNIEFTFSCIARMW